MQLLKTYVVEHSSSTSSCIWW